MGRSNKKLEEEKEKHVCSLPEQEDILVTFISEGWFVPLRRKIKQFFMIDENSKYTKICFKSSFLIDREKSYHLKHHYYMIHPFSKAKEYGDIVIALTLFLSTITIRSNISKFNTDIDLKGNTFFNDDQVLNDLLYFDRVMDIIIFLDIIRIFATGIYREAFNDTLLSPRKVALYYLKGWFIVDILNVLPIYVIEISYYIINKYCPEKYGDFKNIFFVIYFLEASKAFKFLRMINIIQAYQQFNMHFFKVFRLTVITFLIISWISLSLYLVAEKQGEIWLNENSMSGFVLVMHRCFFLFFLRGAPKPTSTSISVICVEIILLYFGYAFYMYSTVQFVHIINLHNATSNKKELIKSRLHSFAEYKNLPEHLKYNLLQSFEYMFHRNYFNEELILKTITGQLKREITEFFAENFVTKIEIFHLLPVKVMATVLNKMKVRLFLPNDIICKQGAKENYLCLIYVGTAAVYVNDNKEICHLYDGDCFGEISLLTNQPRRATVKAVETCKVYKIKSDDLREHLHDYPEIFNTITKIAMSRLQMSREKF